MGRPAQTIPCTIEGCRNLAKARGWCSKHYMRWSEHGHPMGMVGTPCGLPMEFINSLPLGGIGCVIWPFSCSSGGYATVYFNGKIAIVSRIVCERTNGPPPTRRHQAAHTCGNGHGGCIAPWHVQWKTPAENCADKVGHGTLLNGSRCPSSKLTEVDVREIYEHRGLASQRKLAERFGVAQSVISDIQSGKTWRSTTGGKTLEQNVGAAA